MFGQDNNNPQTPSNPSPADSAPPTPANPFAENDMPVPPTPPADASTAPAAPLASSPAPLASPTPTPAPSDDLLNIKQQALQSLQPLVNQLNQSPEEKFKTTMMLIQASDNADLVKQAYETANQITDEKARAQALLDVVNEINYFTHKDNTDSEAKT